MPWVVICSIIQLSVEQRRLLLTAGKRLLQAAVAEHNTWDSAAAMKSIRFTDQQAAKVRQHYVQHNSANFLLGFVSVQSYLISMSTKSSEYLSWKPVCIACVASAAV